MATVTFDDGTNPSVQVAAPKYPHEPGEDYPRVVGRTMNGGVKIADLGDGSNLLEDPVLHFRHQSAADYSSLKTFFTTTTSFGTVPFTYTDAYGTNHTNMYYMGGIKEARRINGKWNWDLRLAKDMSA